MSVFATDCLPTDKYRKHSEVFVKKKDDWCKVIGTWLITFRQHQVVLFQTCRQNEGSYFISFNQERKTVGTRLLHLMKVACWKNQSLFLCQQRIYLYVRCLTTSPLNKSAMQLVNNFMSLNRFYHFFCLSLQTLHCPSADSIAINKGLETWRADKRLFLTKIYGRLSFGKM